MRRDWKAIRVFKGSVGSSNDQSITPWSPGTWKHRAWISEGALPLRVACGKATYQRIVRSGHHGGVWMKRLAKWDIYGSCLILWWCLSNNRSALETKHQNLDQVRLVNKPCKSGRESCDIFPPLPSEARGVQENTGKTGSLPHILTFQGRHPLWK